MRVYHETSPEAAAAIVAEGFRDGEDGYITAANEERRGVWLSDRPFGATGALVLLTVSIPEEVLTDWEWTAWRVGCRMFLVPAEIVNRYGPPELVTGEWLTWTREDDS